MKFLLMNYLILITAFSFVACSEEKEQNGFSGLVFWKYSENDTKEKIENQTFWELYVERPDSLKIPFDNNCEFDANNFEFSFSKINIGSVEFYDLYAVNIETDTACAFFSIVINNKIVLSGLNRIGYYGAKIWESDNWHIPFIVDTPNKKLKITYDYIGVHTNSFIDKEKDRKIDRSNIIDFFNKQ